MFAKQTVDSCDPYIVQTVDRVAHHLGCKSCLFGDGQVGRACCRDQHAASDVRYVVLLQGDSASSLVVCRPGNHREHGGERRIIGARDQQGMTSRDDALGDTGDLGGSFA